MRESLGRMAAGWRAQFPFLFGGTFIEGVHNESLGLLTGHFPSFSEGLSLRDDDGTVTIEEYNDFPSFSEGLSLREMAREGRTVSRQLFPFLFGGTFIEGASFLASCAVKRSNFPSFSEGLSLRVEKTTNGGYVAYISLPFRRDFH